MVTVVGDRRKRVKRSLGKVKGQKRKPGEAVKHNGCIRLLPRIPPQRLSNAQGVPEFHGVDGKLSQVPSVV